LKLVVNDSIHDCMKNINDPDETTEVITWLEQLTAMNRLHVINILHLNKTDGEARGHIGTELQNKAWISIKLELDKSSGRTMVECESSRKKPFEPFAFEHGLDNLPEIVNMPERGGVLPEPERKKRLFEVFEGESLTRSQVIEKMKVVFAKQGTDRLLGDNAAKKLLQEFIRLGWIMKSGRDRDPNTVYKFISSEQQELPYERPDPAPKPSPEPPAAEPAQQPAANLDYDDELPF
jgi:hypothetical protein